MNNGRRKEIAELRHKIDEIQSELEGLRDDEESYRDNIPENLQGSEAYERADAACDALQSCLDSLEESKSQLDEIQ